LTQVCVQARVIHTSEACMSGAFTVTHASTDTSNSVAIKKFGENCEIHRMSCQCLLHYYR